MTSTRSRATGTGLSSSTTIAPYRPANSWSATEPSRWGWHQKVPAGWSVGSW